jgi:hypothetical protein
MSPSDLPLICEQNYSQSWPPKWREIGYQDRPAHLRLALEKLSTQKLLVASALGLDHDFSVSIVPDHGAWKYGVTIKVRVRCFEAEQYFSSLWIESHGRDGEIKNISWDDITERSPSDYEWYLRAAIVKLLRSEVAMKVEHGLQPTARFEDLMKALRKTVKRFQNCRDLLTCTESPDPA